MTKQKTNRDKIAEALQSKGLHNNEHNRAQLLDAIKQQGEDVARLYSIQIEKQNGRGFYYVWIYYKGANDVKSWIDIYDRQNGRGLSLCFDEMTTRQKIENIITSKKWKKEHAHNHQTANGWKCERIKDNKPATIQEIAERTSASGFIFYLLFYRELDGQYKGWDAFALCNWDTTAKRATPSGCPGWFWRSPYNLKDCNEARIQAEKVYILKAPKQEGEEMRAKKETRRSNWHKVGNTCEIMPSERRKEKDIHLSWSCCGYNGEGWKAYSVDGFRVFDQLQTRTTQEQAKAEAIALVYDKSGYRRGERIAELKHEAQTLKAQRLEQEWANTDKSEYIKTLEEIESEIIRDFMRVANSGAFDFYTLHRLEDLGECVRNVRKVKNNIHTYKSGATFAQDLAKCQEMAKKSAILAPLHADPRAYGWGWWELQPSGELKNTYKANTEYYTRITAQSVGEA